jgi:hypothetical protein
MIDKLLSVLQPFAGGAVYEQGTLAPDEDYPAEFITYSYESDSCGYLDNKEINAHWFGAVIFYSSDYSKITSTPPEIRKALRAGGFIVKGKGAPIPSPRPSHDGWALDFEFTEMEA